MKEHAFALFLTMSDFPVGMCSDLDGMVKTAWMFKKKKKSWKKASGIVAPMCLRLPLASEFKYRKKKTHENLFGVDLEQQDGE